MILLFFTLLKWVFVCFCFNLDQKIRLEPLLSAFTRFPQLRLAFQNSPTCPIVLLSYHSADLTSLDFNNIMTFMPRNVS